MYINVSTYCTVLQVLTTKTVVHIYHSTLLYYYYNTATAPYH